MTTEIAILVSAVCAVVGIALGFLVGFLVRKKIGEAKIGSAEAEAQKILDEALPLVEFKLKYLKSKYDLSNVDGRVKYLNDAIDVLSMLTSDVERELYTPDRKSVV